MLIAGNGHVRKDRGVPWYLARMRPDARIVSVGLIEVAAGRRRPAELPFDYVWFTPRAEGQAAQRRSGAAAARFSPRPRLASRRRR